MQDNGCAVSESSDQGFVPQNHHSQCSVSLTPCGYAPQGSASTAEASRPASELCAGRGHWLYFTVPESPAAGGQAVIYFNKACSDPLRCHTAISRRPLARTALELAALPNRRSPVPRQRISNVSCF